LRLLFEVREEVWRWPGFMPGRNLHLIQTDPKTNSNGSNSFAGDFTSGGDQFGEQATITDIVRGADLVVATGAQYMSDACRDDALRVLDRFEAAIRLGIPTAMVGQGIGPLDDPDLRARARDVFPGVDLILVRENLVAPKLLASLHVDPSRVIMTGDDAIEMAYEARTEKWGSAIGVGMRIAHYTEVGQNNI